jgi:hypothetical protein
MSVKKVKLIGWREKEADGAVIVTPWSLMHILSGMAMKSAGLNFTAAFTVHALYEMMDMYKREVGIEFNSSLNSVADQGMAMVGHFLIGKNTDMPYLYLFGGTLLFVSFTESAS